MSARDELAELLAVTEYPNMEPAWKDREDRSPVKFYSRRTADAVLAAGYFKPRPITTIEELDALPDKTIARTCFGDAVTIYRDNPALPVEHYHFLLGVGSPATILYEPAAP